MATRRRRVKPAATPHSIEEQSIIDARAAKVKVKGLTDAEADKLTAELDDQAKQATERDDERESRVRPAVAAYKPGDIAKSLVGTNGGVDYDTLIRVTYGIEKFSPVQFHTFDVGGCFIDVKVRETETAMDAWRRGYAILEQMVAAEFKGKLTGFAKRVAEADAYIRANAAK